MRRIWIVGGILFLLTWIGTLVCVHVAGREGGEVVGTARAEREFAVVAGTTAENKLEKNNESQWQDTSQDTLQADKKILLMRDGLQTYMTLEDYLPGVIACQISETAPLEALKCQAVIARTYISRLMGGRREIQEEELDLDYLEAESGVGIRAWAQMGKAQMGRQQEKLIESIDRCRQAVGETKGLVMKYEDNYILPLFHAINVGRTRSDSGEFPYLQSVESAWDLAAEGYENHYTWTPEEFAGKFTTLAGENGLDTSQIVKEIQTVKRDEWGYVQEMKIGQRTYTGEEVQYALELPSACYTLSGEDGQIRGIVRGKGHGYGLSQAGAAAMAGQGWVWEDILQYYFKNISLVTE